MIVIQSVKLADILYFCATLAFRNNVRPFVIKSKIQSSLTRKFYSLSFFSILFTLIHKLNRVFNIPILPIILLKL